MCLSVMRNHISRHNTVERSCSLDRVIYGALLSTLYILYRHMVMYVGFNALTFLNENYRVRVVMLLLLEVK